MKNASIETKILIVILSILVVVSAGYAGTQLYIRDHNKQETAVSAEGSDKETTEETTTETVDENTSESTTVVSSSATETTSVESSENKTTAATTSSTSPLAFVYISTSGSKYHTADCSYAKNGTKISAEEAIAKGYSPCAVCNPQIVDVTATTTASTSAASVTEAETSSSSTPLAYVYVSASGSKYHTADCYYAKNGTKISAEDAVAKGYTPCSSCNPQIIDVTTTETTTKNANATEVATSKVATSTEFSDKTSSVVYITGSGKKYHTADCRYVNESSSSMSVSDAVSKGYEPCKICNPDSNTGNVTTAATTSLKSTTEKSGNNNSSVVYVTGSGKKYHAASCRYVNESSSSMSVSDAISKGYEPCKICNPGSNSGAETTASTAKTTAASSDSSVVYVTASGKKYHQAGCRYVTDSATKISLKDAIAKGYEPCSICNK